MKILEQKIPTASSFVQSLLLFQNHTHSTWFDYLSSSVSIVQKLFVDFPAVLSTRTSSKSVHQAPHLWTDDGNIFFRGAVALVLESVSAVTLPLARTSCFSADDSLSCGLVRATPSAAVDFGNILHCVCLFGHEPRFLRPGEGCVLLPMIPSLSE